MGLDRETAGTVLVERDSMEGYLELMRCCCSGVTSCGKETIAFSNNKRSRPGDLADDATEGKTVMIYKCCLSIILYFSGFEASITYGADTRSAKSLGYFIIIIYYLFLPYVGALMAYAGRL